MMAWNKPCAIKKREKERRSSKPLGRKGYKDVEVAFEVLYSACNRAPQQDWFILASFKIEWELQTRHQTQ
ncbi:unnamed protein product [Allacma fusca]|uniref:Uncharacterized protein n=1 Tax=Allacma fusca TaxID=39272 RepID=A0A8J2LN88_9HEXA|nr:unnamed protein product [Allacma fusca]